MTLVEVLLALAIIAVIAAIVIPTTANQLRIGHSAALANQLVNLRDAIARYRENVGAFPIGLTQLTTQPGALDTDACGTLLSVAERNGWRGPYINKNVVAALPVGDALVQTILTRVPANTAITPIGVLQIQSTSVDNDIALALEQQFDGNNNLTTGTILWAAAGGGTLTFQIPIRGC
jgi:type II secretory pathway pseudopilin PulG